MTDLCICVGSACHLKGSYSIIEKFKYCVDKHGVKDSITIKAAFCLGNCTEAVSVKFKDTVYSVLPETAESFFDEVVMGTVKEA